MDCSINECKAKNKPLITDHIKTYPTLKNNNDQFLSTHFQSTVMYYSSPLKFIVFSDGTESSSST